MKKENRTHILLRYILVIGFILLFAGWIICHSFDNTVMSANKWNDKAMSELSRVVEISPERGNILSNNGQILATNLSFYHVRILRDAIFSLLIRLPIRSRCTFP